MNNIIIFILILIIFSIFYFLNQNLKYKIVTYENFQNNNIPKIIIQTWKTKNIPEKYKEDYNSIRKYNPDFQFLFFSDNDIIYFLENNYPKYYKSYKKLPLKIQKIDYFKYIAIYHYGGFYFDLDMVGLYPLNELLDYDSVFPVEQNIRKRNCNVNRFKKYCKIGLNFMLGQYAFGAKPQNDFIKLLIDTIHENIDLYIHNYKKDGKTSQYVYSTTGSDFITSMYIDYNKKDDIHILEFDHSQYFGKYAKHKHYGVWKK